MERKQRSYSDMTWWYPYVESITDEALRAGIDILMPISPLAFHYRVDA